MLHLTFMPFVSSSIYHKAVRLALSEGLASQLLETHQHFQESSLHEKYLPINLLFEVYEFADQYLEAGFGIRLGKQMTSDDYGTLGLAWKTCWCARDILTRTVRYMILVTDQGSARIEDTGSNTKIVLERLASQRAVEISNETTFVMLIGILREVTGQEIYPLQVSFQHPCTDSSLYQAYFKSPVQFGASENFLLFRIQDLDIPAIKADRHIQEYLLERMEEEKQGISIKADSLLRDIQKLIKESLPSGIPSIIQVADHHGLSARTLKRRLGEKGKTFRELVQNVQQQEAMVLLKNTRQSISEIAFLTGFSEQSAFNRAFRRWTGKPPSDYRKQL